MVHAKQQLRETVPRQKECKQTHSERHFKDNTTEPESFSVSGRFQFHKGAPLWLKHYCTLNYVSVITTVSGV